MISYNRFTTLLKQELLDPLFLLPQGYVPSHSTKITDFEHNHNGISYGEINVSNDFNGYVMWSHEEPLNQKDLNDLSYKNFYNPAPLPECKEWRDIHMYPVHNMLFNVNFHMFANSEKSSLKKEWLNTFPKYAKLYDWYFFFHGFAALDWYRDFKVIHNPLRYQIDKVFMCLNHLIENKRSYRMLLLSHLKEKALMNHGMVSCPMLDQKVIKKELADQNSLLSIDAKKHIFKNLYPKAQPIILDAIDYNAASADIPEYVHQSMWSIVTETVYYEEKLHLTEKIFKPIVTKKPFILVGAVNNLSYLKSYGFQTFDRWIDESYDQEPDHEKRIEMITNEIAKLCAKPKDQLRSMYQEMQEVLNFNHSHFYGKFKEIIVDELLNNFLVCVNTYNKDLSERFRLPVENLNMQQTRARLLD